MTAAGRVVVAGAGLAGLVAADRLASAGADVRVVEARSRVGGRLMTVASQSSAGGCFDLGATWRWDGQPRLEALVASLGLASFPQHDRGAALHDHPGEPPSRLLDAGLEPAFRLEEGGEALARALLARLPAGAVLYDARVKAVEATVGGVSVVTTSPEGDEAVLRADFVVLALPPRLVVQDVRFNPALPDELVEVMAATPTWMASAVKCVVVYERPFWREAGLSGSVFSHAGPLHEIHDASGPDGSPGALWGLLGEDPAVRSLAPADRVRLVLAQLERLFGPEAADPADYFERDWSADPNTNESVTDLGIVPLDYGHPAFARPALDGRLVWAGAETAGAGGGHMEGAVASAERAVDLVLAGRPAQPAAPV
ncbi:MAG TPA: FAD-dependent oxidoreductase [Acidimicrobiales bacterium]|nr:FAD-dependent oxidoreductase [Acidimicrobiales bacterium]